MKRAPGVSSRLRALDSILKSPRKRCELETLAVRRQMADLETGGDRGLRWDEDEATRAVRFFDLLKHWKGEWANKRLELSPWQEHCIVAPVYGWKREDGTRRFRTAYVEVPRKNGKTTMLSGIGLKGLIADSEPGAEIYAAATKRDQAAIVFKDAKNVLTGELKELVKLQRSAIRCPQWDSEFHPLSSDYSTLDGLNIHVAIVDELHAHKTRELWDVLDTGTGARRQPLLFAITTAGFDRQSICWEQHEYVRGLLQGTHSDDAYFGFIAAADADDDWRDPEIWEKANPNYGISVKPEKLAEAVRKAQDSPAAENNVRRKHLDQWTEQDVRWLSMLLWDQNAEEVREDDLAGRECLAGIDMASTRDLASLVLLFPPTESDPLFRVLHYCWCPKESVDPQAGVDKRGYAGWIGKYITPTEGKSIDQSFIRARIWGLREKFRFVKAAFDPREMTECYQQLVREGWPQPEETLLQFGQSYGNYNEAMKKLLELLRDHKLAHGGNPVLRWMASNLVAGTNAHGQLYPHKGKSGGKIDGMTALLMALALFLSAKGEAKSFYESNSLELI